MLNQISGGVTVAAAGTRQVLSSTSINVTWLRILAKAGNSGNIFVGDSNVSSTNYGDLLAANGSLIIAPGNGINAIDLSQVYVDTSNSGDGVWVLYVQN